MPITTQSELPEWENLVNQVNALYRLLTDFATLATTVTLIDKNVAVIQADVTSLKNDTRGMRNDIEHLKWGSPAALADSGGSVDWRTLALVLVVLMVFGAVLYLVALR